MLLRQSLLLSTFNKLVSLVEVAVVVAVLVVLVVADLLNGFLEIVGVLVLVLVLSFTFKYDISSCTIRKEEELVNVLTAHTQFLNSIRNFMNSSHCRGCLTVS